MLRKAVCIGGDEAARLFYEPDRFTRKGAMPPTTLKLLQDRGSVQQLDGEAHRRRKQMFMALMTPEAIERLVGRFRQEWRGRLAAWQQAQHIMLLDEAREILCRAVCGWAGLALSESALRRRSREFGAMVDGAGSVGPRNWIGQLLRARSERWARGIVAAHRAGRLAVEEGGAAHVVSSHREPSGALLSEKVAAVELINLLRPTVAVGQYVVFAALALHQHPECREQLAREDDAWLEAFVHEVRRFYPFFPFVGGRVRTRFSFAGRDFAEGEWVLLDIYGTNRDARLWRDPDAFQPERFRNRPPGAFDLVPQGAGDHHRGHRCAGEWITIALMKEAVRLLVREMRYGVPDQDLSIDLSRMPAMPRSGFRIAGVRKI